MMIGGKLFGFNYKCNLTFKNTFCIFSFIGSICTFKYSHLIEPRVEGQKVASHGPTKSSPHFINGSFGRLLTNFDQL